MWDSELDHAVATHKAGVMRKMANQINEFSHPQIKKISR